MEYSGMYRLFPSDHIAYWELLLNAAASHLMRE